MLKRWNQIIEYDQAYSPNLTLHQGDFGLAFPPRIKTPWRQSEPQQGHRRRPMSRFQMNWTFFFTGTTNPDSRELSDEQLVAHYCNHGAAGGADSCLLSGLVRQIGSIEQESVSGSS